MKLMKIQVALIPLERKKRAHSQKLRVSLKVAVMDLKSVSGFESNYIQCDKYCPSWACVTAGAVKIALQ